ncbi:MAG TPA: hypothetical protein VI408_09650 [Gaiellaceae bacterium]
MGRGLLLTVLAALALPASALAWGGTYPTGDSLGTSIRIEVSDAYPVDQTLPQKWAAFFGTLVHGSELSSLTLRLAPMDDVARTCGSQALACYDPSSSTIVTSPEDELDEPPAQEVVTHEYGHHIANHRSDAPWTAEDWGTKRWATYEHICSRALAGTASPGNEGGDYRRNPGEAFAEAYRVLNLTQEGATSIGWDIVDRSFYPDAKALSLLEQDIVSPWTGPTTTHAPNARVLRVATPLDGAFTARLRAPDTAKLRLVLHAGSRIVARGFRSVSYDVCGARTLTLRVLGGAHVRYTVDVSKP